VVNADLTLSCALGRRFTGGANSATRQYGLIGKEVAKVYPELVTRGPDDLAPTFRRQREAVANHCNAEFWQPEAHEQPQRAE